MAVRLLKAALPKRLLTLEDALAIVDYHLQRNAEAKRSHTKTWRKQHPEVNIHPLLQAAPS